MRKFYAVLSSGVVGAGLLVAAFAHAIPLPDTGSSCTSGVTCFGITTTSTNQGFPVAIRGNASGAVDGTGVYGTGSQYGVLGTGNAAGVSGTTTNQTSSGVLGQTSGSGSYGVSGWSTGTEGVGVHGQGSDFGVTAEGNVAGVSGQTSAPLGSGVIGQGWGTSSYGVFGSGTGYGVYGITINNSAYGVYGKAMGTNSFGVYGLATETGVFGSSTAGIAVRGDGFLRGVHGNASSSTGIGVSGAAPPGSTAKAVYGVLATPGAGFAIYGDNNTTNANGWAGFFNGRFRATGAATFASTLTVSGTPFANQTTFSPISDGRLKKNVEPLTGAIDELLKLRGVTFEWKNPAEHDNQIGRQRGFIAQDVEKAIPDWVIKDPEGFKRLNLRGFEAVVVESIRTLKTENDSLRDRMKVLEAKQAFASAGLNGNGLLGLGLMALAGAAVVASRRRTTISSV